MLETLLGFQGPVVPYLQHQNSSLTAELAPLLEDVDAELPWATEAFGAPPDAVNLVSKRARCACGSPVNLRVSRP